MLRTVLAVAASTLIVFVWGALSWSVLPDAGDRIASNGVRNHQFPRGCRITIGDGNLAISRGVKQGIEITFD